MEHGQGRRLGCRGDDQVRNWDSMVSGPARACCMASARAITSGVSGTSVKCSDSVARTAFVVGQATSAEKHFQVDDCAGRNQPVFDERTQPAFDDRNRESGARALSSARYACFQRYACSIHFEATKLEAIDRGQAVGVAAACGGTKRRWDESVVDGVLHRAGSEELAEASVRRLLSISISRFGYVHQYICVSPSWYICSSLRPVVAIARILLRALLADSFSSTTSVTCLVSSR